MGVDTPLAVLSEKHQPLFNYFKQLFAQVTNPPMKLPKSVVKRRIDLMTDEGVSFVTGVDAAQPKTAKRLMEEYDAVILCCGAERPRPMVHKISSGASCWISINRWARSEVW